jgi:hypothetical protein
MVKKGLYKPVPADFLIATLVLLFSITPLFSFTRQAAGAPKTATVFLDNKVFESLDLGKDGVYRVSNMEIEVNRGRVRVAKSDCPRQICSHTGWISAQAQTIVCVPNKVLVEIKGGGENKYDAVSY